MRGRRFWSTIGLACLGLTGGCLSTDTGSNEVVSGVLVGRVTRTADGTGVGGAGLYVQLESLPQNGTSQILTSGGLMSATDGNFTVTFLVQGNTDMPARVRLSVTAPLGSQLAGLDTSAVPINLYRLSPPVDTTWLFVELPPR